MNYRVAFSVIYAVLIVLLTLCAVRSLRSHKKIGKSLFILLFSILPPMAGNLIIMGSINELSALIGYYFYYLGMDMLMAALVNFTAEYCKGIGKPDQDKQKPTVMYLLLGMDMIQMIMNIFTGHAFSVEAVNV